jgi:hypothetical protein
MKTIHQFYQFFNDHYDIKKEKLKQQLNHVKQIITTLPIPIESILKYTTFTINNEPSISGRLALFNIKEPFNDIFKILESSLNESIYDTIKILFYLRDCRSNKKCRQLFIISMAYISDNYPDWFEVNFMHIPLYGRWLDLIEIYRLLFHHYHKDLITTYITNQLNEDQYNMHDGESISFLAKWIPSENKKFDRNSNINEEICKKLFHVDSVNSHILKRYRKEYLSPLRKYMQICEIFMCANEWDKIDFTYVPVIAMKKYYSAFKRHSPEKFNNWLRNLHIHSKELNPEHEEAIGADDDNKKNYSTCSNLKTDYEKLRKIIDDIKYNIIQIPKI